MNKAYWCALIASAALTTLYAMRQDLADLHAGYVESGARVERLAEDREALVQERERLDRRVRHLGSDPVELEASIRESRNLVREGETIYRIEIDENAPMPKPYFSD